MKKWISGKWISGSENKHDCDFLNKKTDNKGGPLGRRVPTKARNKNGLNEHTEEEIRQTPNAQIRNKQRRNI